MKRRRQRITRRQMRKKKQKKKKTMLGLFVLVLFLLNLCHVQQQNRRELR
jgi:hypothetical protein